MNSENSSRQWEPTDDVVASLRSGDVEGALQQLKALGFPFIRAVKVLHDVGGLSLADSKQTVHESRVWADGRSSREEFWEELAVHMETIDGE